MSKINDGGPAFPYEKDAGAYGNTGMMLLDYFAAQAMLGLLSVEEIWEKERTKFEVAKLAYDQAEAMLAERERRMKSEDQPKQE